MICCYLLPYYSKVYICCILIFCYSAIYTPTDSITPFSYYIFYFLNTAQAKRKLIIGKRYYFSDVYWIDQKASTGCFSIIITSIKISIFMNNPLGKFHYLQGIYGIFNYKQRQFFLTLKFGFKNKK